MSIRKSFEVYVCDFCRYFHSGPYDVINIPDEAFNAVFSRWFLVNKTSHACKHCGHKLHSLLAAMGIDHKFVCTEYIMKPETMGIIDIERDTR